MRCYRKTALSSSSNRVPWVALDYEIIPVFDVAYYLRDYYQIILQ